VDFEFGDFHGGSSLSLILKILAGREFSGFCGRLFRGCTFLKQLDVPAARAGHVGMPALLISMPFAVRRNQGEIVNVKQGGFAEMNARCQSGAGWVVMEMQSGLPGGAAVVLL